MRANLSHRHHYHLEIHASAACWQARLRIQSPVSSRQAAPEPSVAGDWLEFQSPLALLEWLEAQTVPPLAGPDVGPNLP